MPQKLLPKLITFTVIVALLLVSNPPNVFGSSAAKPAAYPAWAPNTAYAVGALVTYNGVDYRCLQAHTSQVGWEPPNVPALWQVVTGGPTTTATRTNTPGGPTATRTRTPTATSTSSGGTCWPAWVATTAYNGGAQVSRNGQNYQAAYWTQNQDPVTNSGPAGSGQPWIPMGACGGGGATATATATRTNTPGGPTATRTRTRTPFPSPSATGVSRTNTPTGPSATPTRTPTQGSGILPKHILVGYWHNFDNGSTNIRLRNISSNFDVIVVAFAETTGNGNMTFTPYNTTQAEFQSDVAYLKSIGKKVLLSVGGQNGSADVSTATAKQNFINSMTSIISTYGFNGLDIDLENGISVSGDFRNPSEPQIVNLISATRTIAGNFSNFILSMAPETAYVQGGYVAYGGPWGGYLPIIYGLRDILTYIHVQHYNTGGMTALDGRTYSQGTADFHVAMADMLLQGFPVAGNTSNLFPALRQDQVAFGVPASPSAASGGYTSNTAINQAVNYIARGQSFGGQYVLLNPSGYPNFRGLMTWSINWDAVNGFSFSNNARTLLNGLP